MPRQGVAQFTAQRARRRCDTMSKLHLRYLIIAAIVTAITAIAFQQFIGTLLIPENRKA